MDLENGQGFTAKLDAAQASYEKAVAPDFVNTINQLEAFKNKCDDDILLSVEDRIRLKGTADRIIMVLQNII